MSMKHYWFYTCSFSWKLWLIDEILASLSFFCRYCFGRCSSQLTELALILHSSWGSTHYSNWLHNFSVIIPKYYKDLFVNSFSQTTRLWYSLFAECFPLTYDQDSFKRRVKPLCTSPTKWSNTQTVCLGLFDHFVGLALNRLIGTYW